MAMQTGGRMTMCKHMEFDAMVRVARLEDSGQFMADITVKCRECGIPMQFLGLEPGLDLQGARVSVDGLEAHLAIAPLGTQPSPLDRIQYAIRTGTGRLDS